MTIQSLSKLYNWQGATPFGWVLEPMRYCVALRQNGDWGDEPDDDEEEGNYCLRAADFDYDTLGLKDKRSFAKRKYSAARFNKVKLRPGDLLVEKAGGGEKVPVGRAVLFHGQLDACFSNFLERIRVLPNVSPRFFFYWWTAGYQSSAFVPYFNQTTGIQNLNSNELLSRCSIALPPLEEQERISDAIDVQYSLMNKSVATLSEEVDVLGRYRASVIHKAVTKGLSPDAPMKPSGIDWIGEIPERWKISRLRYLAKMESGATPSKDNLEYWNGDIPWVSSIEVKSELLEDTSLHISETGVSSCSTRLLPTGTLVMVVRSGILQHTIPVALLGKPMTVNQDIKALTFGPEMLGKYFLYFVKGNNQNLLKVLCKDKSTVDNINQEYLKSLIIPLPSLGEQKKIIEYLDARTAAIDTVLETKRKQIDVLKRRRQSLIYEYVTGKRRVEKEI